MPMESFLSEETKARLTEKFGIMANSFDHNVLTILALASDEGCVTNIRLRYSLTLHKSEISDLLKLMTQKGLLVSEGYGRGMRYFLPANSLNVFRADAQNMATSESDVVTSDTKYGNLNEVNMATSDVKYGNLGDMNMVTPTKKKMSRDELQQTILAHCNQWISLEELAIAVYRAPKYLRNFILPILLASKKVQMMYPTSPNHPKQQYKISD